MPLISRYFFISGSWLLISIVGLHGLSVQATTVFPWPAEGNTVLGDNQVTQVANGETLLDIAERYGLGYADIRDANPSLDPWIPTEGSEVTLPTRYILPTTSWEGIVINLAEYRLFYFRPEQSVIYTYPVGIGRGNTPTPQGNMQISARIPDPIWYPPASIRQRWEKRGEVVHWQVPPGPENPLGPYAINLSAEGYLIHGTNQRFGIGAQTSAGCIRMNNSDIEALLHNTQIGVPVRIIDNPTSVGVLNNQLVLSAHAPINSEQTNNTHTDLVYALSVLRQQHNLQSVQIDWQRVKEIFYRQEGIVEVISH